LSDEVSQAKVVAAPGDHESLKQMLQATGIETLVHGRLLQVPAKTLNLVAEQKA